MDMPMNVPAILDKLIDYTSRANPAIRAHLQPPCTLEYIQQHKPFAYYFPRDALALYQWHNGTQFKEDDPWEALFYYHRFLPFEEAVEEYHEMHRLGGDVYDPHLFPLFTFMGEYYSIWCTEEPQDHSPIYFVYHGEAQAYDHLESMLHSIRECYESGAYALVNGDYTPNEQRVAEIKLKWNRCRSTVEGIMGHHP